MTKHLDHRKELFEAIVSFGRNFDLFIFFHQQLDRCEIILIAI